MKLRSDYNLPKVSEPNRLYSANEFKSFIAIAKRDETADIKPEIKPLGDESANLLSKVEPGKSSIDEYEHIWIG